jgi:glycosyltransferase involved in cell wall biosynthesis
MAGDPILLFIREPDLGGSERQAAATARLLQGDCFTPHFGCFRRSGVRLAELESAGIPVVEFPVRSFSRPLPLWRQLRALRRYVGEHGIRLIHSFDTPTNLFVTLAAALGCGAEITLTSQRSFRTLRTARERRLLRLSDRVSDGIVVNCEAVRRSLEAGAGAPRAPISVCYNAIETERFRRLAERPASIPAGAVTIGTVSALRPEKDLLTLVEAFAACRRNEPNLFLLIVGDGPVRDAVQAKVRALGVEAATRLQPGVEDVLPWLSAIDIFALCSRSEALSNALMEAMAAGCACVASEVGGNPELIESGRTGLLFPAGDAQGLARQLMRLAGDEELRRRLADAATASVEARFAARRSAARMAEIYRSYLETRRR